MSTPIQGKAISLFGKPLTPVPPNPVANDGIKFNFTTLQWELAPFGGAGEANTSSNVGTGAVLALPKVGVDLPFKSLSGNPEIVLTPTATEILFAIGAIAQSKITGLVADLLTKIETSSNVGAGAGLALAKVGVDLPFKSFIALAPLLLTVNPNDITISTTQKNTFILGTATDGSIGGGSNFRHYFGEGTTGTEANTVVQLQFTFTIVRHTLHLNTNSTNLNTEFSLRDDGADVPNTLLIVPAGVTGFFDSGAISEVIVSGSLINVEWNRLGTAAVGDIGVMVECEK